MSKRNPTPAQVLRSKLIATRNARGSTNANIWLVYCHANEKEYTLVGDLRFELYLVAEGDPRVIEANYSPAPVPVDILEARHEIQFDVVVRLDDGCYECWSTGRASARESQDPSLVVSKRSLHVHAAASIGATFRHFCVDDFDTLQQRTINWRRVTAIMTRAKATPLAQVIYRLKALFGNGSRWTLGDITLALSDVPCPIVHAAAFHLVRSREWRSDLDTKPLGPMTYLWLGARS